MLVLVLAFEVLQDYNHEEGGDQDDGDWDPAYVQTQADSKRDWEEETATAAQNWIHSTATIDHRHCKPDGWTKHNRDRYEHKHAKNIQELEKIPIADALLAKHGDTAAKSWCKVC